MSSRPVQTIFLKPDLTELISESAGNKAITLSGKQPFCHILQEVALLNISKSELLYKAALKINSYKVNVSFYYLHQFFHFLFLQPKREKNVVN